MKKVIILSTAAAMLSIVAFAQDTIPKKDTTLLNRRDTFVTNSKDTLQRKWKDADSSLSMQPKKWNKDSINNPGADSLLSRNNGADSTNPTALNNGSKQDVADSAKKLADSSKDIAMNQKNNYKAMADPAATTPVTDRVMMKDEKMFLIKEGELTPLEKSYKLESGAVVNSEGQVKFPSGKTVQLKNGQFIELKPIEKTPDAKSPAATKKSPVKKKPTS